MSTTTEDTHLVLIHLGIPERMGDIVHCQKDHYFTVQLISRIIKRELHNAGCLIPEHGIVPSGFYLNDLLYMFQTRDLPAALKASQELLDALDLLQHAEIGYSDDDDDPKKILTFHPKTGGKSFARWLNDEKKEAYQVLLDVRKERLAKAQDQLLKQRFSEFRRSMSLLRAVIKSAYHRLFK